MSALGRGYYTPEQTEAAIRFAFGVDSRLIADGTYFVAPGHARRGIGAALPRAAGFTRLELMSTLPGVPFYAKLGFTEAGRVTDVLPDGTSIEFVPMTRSVT